MHLGKQADSALADERLSPQPTLREYPKNGAPGDRLIVEPGMAEIVQVPEQPWWNEHVPKR